MLSTMNILLFLGLIILFFGVNGLENEREGGPNEMNQTIIRSKRYDGYYGGGYDYGWGPRGYRGDWWYSGRWFGIIVVIFLFLLCCCVPGICLLGIWFAGWFGIKQRRDARMKQGGTMMNGIPSYQTNNQPNIVQLHSEPQPVIRTIHPSSRARSHSPPPRTTFASSSLPAEQVIYQAEDRYYTSSSASPHRHHNSRI